jgi:predicted nuclease of restriction endonuclease-like RecB superfamily
VLSTPLLRFELARGAVEPAYLDDRHAQLVRALLLHHEAFLGARWRELEVALEAARDVADHEPRLVAGLRRVIEESVDLRAEAPADPRRVREAVFELGRRDLDLGAGDVRRRAAERLGISPAEVAGALYADLRDEKRVRLARPLPSTAAVISRYNLRLLQGLLLHAERLRVEVQGQARAVYRFAKLHGLIVEAREEAPGGALVLEVTGPLSIFRRTLKYGRALACFLPACAAAGRFRLEARLAIRGVEGRLTVTQADRVLSTHAPPRLFDSRVEERLFKDFARLGSRWEVSREASLIATSQGAFLPDFTFRPRDDPAVSVDLEIVGFWTRGYLERKRRIAEELAGRRVIFCVDEALGCGEEWFPAGAIRYARRVPAEQVLEALERSIG